MLRRKTELGQRLQMARIKHALSLGQVGKLIKVDKGHLSRIERGEAVATRKVLIDYATVVGLDPNEVLVLAGMSIITDDDDAALFASLSNKWLLLDIAQRQRLVMLAAEYAETNHHGR